MCVVDGSASDYISRKYVPPKNSPSAEINTYVFTARLGFGGNEANRLVILREPAHCACARAHNSGGSILVGYRSRGDEVPELLVQKEKMASLELKSIWNEEGLLDIPFSLEEVKGAITKLKRKKAAGPDGVVAEHLIAGSDAVSLWLKGILNAVIEMEKIPAVLKCGVVVLVYKGGGRDPLSTNNYRGVTLTSVIAKVLEFLVLQRLQVIFLEAGIPHRNQTAYQKAISCADAIFSTQVVIAKYMRGGSRVFMCLYDLQKAFDSAK